MNISDYEPLPACGLWQESKSAHTYTIKHGSGTLYPKDREDARVLLSGLSNMLIPATLLDGSRVIGGVRCEMAECMPWTKN